MKTENKVRAHITSPKGENQIDECDLIVAFGFSEDDDRMEVQAVSFGGDINATKTVAALGNSVSKVVSSFAKDRIHALLLQKLICAAIRDGMEKSSGEKDFFKKFFREKIK